MKDDNGRVCIPIQMRKEMEISSGRSIEFLADGDKTIIQKYEQEVPCIFCSGMHEVHAFRGTPGLRYLAELDDSTPLTIVRV